MTLTRRSSLKRTPLTRKSRLRKGRGFRRYEEQAALRERTIALHGPRSLLTPEIAHETLQCAHLIDKQWLAANHLEHVIQDERLCVMLSPDEHADHDNWARNGRGRISRKAVPPIAWVAAKRHGLTWRLELEFPR